MHITFTIVIVVYYTCTACALVSYK